MLSGAAFFVTGLVVLTIIAADPFNEATFGPATPAALAIVLVIHGGHHRLADGRYRGNYAQHHCKQVEAK